MAHSLRRAAREPTGTFENRGTRFTISSDEHGTRQRMERNGETSEYEIAYVVGSGNHASGYLLKMGDHLFQSPIAYYSERRKYDMAPGYETTTDPDFTRPVTQECVLCHSGKPMHIAGTINRYRTPEFEAQAISCERCHGAIEEHLRRPVAGSIVNPAKLSGAARDSICEQCHLSGLIRILNPGKKPEDFRPGEVLEETLTVYMDALPPSRLKVISHSEQLAASACLRNSGGKLWCGTCHDPHQKPVDTASYYRNRCLSCHTSKLPASHPAPENRNCIGCHMLRRNVFDGGHTAFTDHRILRRPAPEAQDLEPTDLIAWRNPNSGLAKRNLALAYIDAGLQRNAPAWIVRGYRMLTEAQSAFPDDPMVLNGFGAALMAGKQPQEARFAFQRLIELQPDSPVNEENAGRADLAAGNVDGAITHLERAVQLDPLQLSADGLLESIYEKQGKNAQAAAIAERVQQAMKSRGLRPPK